MDERLAFTHPRSDRRVSRGGIPFSKRGISCWNPASSDSTGSLAVDDGHEAEGRSTQPHRPVEHRLEHRREVAGRRIDDLQYFRGCGLLLRELIALGKGLVETPLQLSVGTLKVEYFVIECRAHVLAPSRLAPDLKILRPAPASGREKRATRSPYRRKRQVGLGFSGLLTG